METLGGDVNSRGVAVSNSAGSMACEVNAIVVSNDAMTLGVGAGQMNRVSGELLCASCGRQGACLALMPSSPWTTRWS